MKFVKLERVTDGVLFSIDTGEGDGVFSEVIPPGSKIMISWSDSGFSLSTEKESPDQATGPEDRQTNLLDYIKG